MRLSFSTIYIYRLILLAGFFLVFKVTQGQSLRSLNRDAINTQHITISHGDSVENFTIAATSSKQKADLKRTYHWYTSGSLKQTQGGYSGKLVHGKYQLFNHKKDLLAQGQLSYGLKVDFWKYWYADGTLQKTENWKHGLQHGKYVLYSPEGAIQEEGILKHGLLHGRRRIYPTANPDSVVVEKYKKGKLIVPKKKKESARKMRKKAKKGERKAKKTELKAKKKAAKEQSVSEKKKWTEKLLFWKKKKTDSSQPAEKKQKSAKKPKTEKKNKEPKEKKSRKKTDTSTGQQP
ncbi:toxin-antitoxin system YwqK family antitoxin [Xanthocytophaga flava]|uniref:toxin-antitoxin system YwqK family antitoxin n=1 Tax=Xanthocytophaga flava TaxID=3048013 RepID=UPI0028D3E928|nr:hypothetical protein [Xanthocytophaga flavus]MDJ1473291.1 hypothetical protein [Xanthocytophaga flavus]